MLLVQLRDLVVMEVSAASVIADNGAGALSASLVWRTLEVRREVGVCLGGANHAQWLARLARHVDV